MLKALVVFALVALVSADLYMHNPPGANNRNRGTGGAVTNNARLCNTQNNNNGGYCWGPKMTFYAGSLLRIEWTNQHSCGPSDKIDCQLVIQYMCQPLDESGNALDQWQVRDGVTTNTIPDDEATFNQPTNEQDLYEIFEYGMNEGYWYYQGCKTRRRNEGLLILDQDVNGNTARHTRQNNNGNRRGFECPEERDYYPYWHPTPWKDIAVLVSNKDRCPFFQSNSFNVMGKGICYSSDPAEQTIWGGFPRQLQYNQEQPCTSNGGSWVIEEPWGIGEPDCQLAPVSRDNHLGNSYSVEDSSYNNPVTPHYLWKLPTDVANTACVLRLRYNMSVGDYDMMQDSTCNGPLNECLTEDPFTDVSPGGTEFGHDGVLNVSMAIDTSQTARTFQDRSHPFEIAAVPRGSGFPKGAARIFNLNVRGKRGNIVQTYPAVEYDFVPNHMKLKVGDWIHFQWTGCDTNPANNDGEGTDSTDRSNIVQIASRNHNVPMVSSDESSSGWLFKDADLRALFAWAGQDPALCQTYDELRAENPDDDDLDRDPQNCMKLNAASAYFDGGLIKMSRQGIFHFMSSRNNNFSNRGQKATISVEHLVPTWSLAVIGVGAAFGVAAVVLVILKVAANGNPGLASCMG